MWRAYRIAKVALATYLQNISLSFVHERMESNIRQRLVALSLFVSMLAGVVIPPASAYAADHFVPPTTPSQHTTKPAADANKPMATNYPGPLPDGTADNSIAPAAGAQTPSFLQSTTSIFNQQPARTDLDQKSREAANVFAYKPSMQDHGQVRSGATATHKKKTLLAEGRTEFNKVYLNEDGTKTLQKSMQPSSYRDGTGSWKDVNVALQDNPSHDHLQTTANSWGASFGKNDITQGIALTKDGQSLTFKPIGGQTSKPVVTGTAPNQLITYKNVWPGVDVQYQAEAGQLKESIIITSSAGIRAGYQFDVQGATLSPDPNQPGWLTADGAFSNFTVAPPTMNLFTRYPPGRVNILL